MNKILKKSLIIAATIAALYTTPYIAKEVANKNTQMEKEILNNNTLVTNIVHTSYNLDKIHLSRAENYSNKIIGENIIIHNAFDTKVLTILDGYDYSKDGLVDVIEKENTNIVKTKYDRKILYRNTDYKTHKPEFDKADKLLKDTKNRFIEYLY
ncbi:MAG: hypothetical protein ACP5N1_07115 [Candidatus Woesearchaeota archaeon]